MSRYLAARAVEIAVTLALMSFIVYLLIGLMPGDPINMMIASDPRMTSEDAARLRALYGLDKPLLERYLAWAGQILQGNLGYSSSLGQPVLAAIGPRLLNTLELAGLAFVLSIAIGLPLGMWAAAHPRSRADYLINLFCFAGISTPPFWLALLLITLFAVTLGWLPAGGMAELKADAGGEGPLRRAAGGTAAADRLRQCHGVHQPRLGGSGDDRGDPPLDQGERGLQPGERDLLLRRGLRAEQPLAGQRLAQRLLRVGHVHLGQRVAQLVHVHGDARRVRLDRAEQVLAEPRHVPEQPVVRRLAQREEQPHLADVNRQALAERGDAGRQQRRGPLGRERQSDVGGAGHVAGQFADRRADLAAEHRPAELLHHRRERAEPAHPGQHGPHLLGHVAVQLVGIEGHHGAHRVDRLGGDRVA